MNTFCRIALLAAALLMAQAAHAADNTFRDCTNCPEMVTIPAGNFQTEAINGNTDEKSRQQVTVAAPFALAKFEVTVGEFRRFTQTSGYRTDAERDSGGIHACHAMDNYDDKTYRYWDSPGFTQTEQQPVACISLNDAHAYVKWLEETTGKPYRLPGEAEWEYAARAGSNTSRYWGDDPNQACLYAKVADQTKGPNGISIDNSHNCNDGYFFTAPVGTYKPNAFGLHDMIGNAWEWVENSDSDSGTATDVSAKTGKGTTHLLRGGSWFNGPQFSRAAASVSEESDRNGVPMFRTLNCMGFRVASTLP